MQVLGDVLRGEGRHAEGEHDHRVREEAASCLGQWGLNRAKEQAGEKGWPSVRIIAGYWQERGMRDGVGVAVFEGGEVREPGYFHEVLLILTPLTQPPFCDTLRSLCLSGGRTGSLCLGAGP